MTTSVFLTGASGYIAQHIVQQLTEAGYRVIGTVRTKEKGDKLRANAGENFEYEIVPDISEPGAFDEALKKHPEVTAFLHTASPFFYAESDVKNNIVRPAIEGTKNALESVKKYGKNVTRVVITSSFAAIIEGSDVPSNVYTEESWNPITWDDNLEDPMTGYRASKTFAERIAWEFLKNEKPQFTLNVVNPVFVLGPQAYSNEVKETLNTSAEFINNLLKIGPQGTFEDRLGNFIDVRDTARAHVYALETPESGLRLLVAESKYNVSYLLNIIHENFPQLKDKLPPAPEKVKLSDLDSLSGVINNSKTRALLGEWKTLDQSVVDSVKQILESGV